jgi:predicted P-loop ATPase/GTPase
LVITIVSGLLPYESGKTWFTVSVGLALRKAGYSVGVFKPVAGHNIWYSPRTFLESIKLGVLVGNDILAYYRTKLVDDIPTSNPIAIAALPPDPLKYTRVEDYMENFENIESISVLTRIYNCKQRFIEHYVHPENTEKVSKTCKRIVEKLQESLNAKSKPFSDISRYLTSSLVEEDLDYCLKTVSAGKDFVFVEGFNDTVTPYLKLLNTANVLVVVAPSKVLVYENMDHVREVINKATSKLGFEGFRTRYVVKELEPDYVFETGLSLKPSPKKVHFDFMKILLEKHRLNS